MTGPQRMLSEIWPAVPAAFASLPISGLTADSRRVQPGDVFIALHGLQRDGREFVNQALAAGAAVALVERGGKWLEDREQNGVPVLMVDELPHQLGFIAARFFGEPSRRLTVLAVTGTNGKTSVAHLLAGSLAALGHKAAVLGTVGNGIYGQLQKSTHTTLDPIELQRLLAEFADAGVDYVAMEASSHGLAQGRLHGTRIETALFTNLSRDHLDYHGTMSAYAGAKAKLFGWPELRAAVLNADDVLHAELRATLAPDVRCLSYSQHAAPTAELVAENVEPSLNGLAMQVRTPQGNGELRSPLLGRFNVSNLLAVLGGLLSVRVSLADALRVLARVPAVPGRMQCFGGGDKPLVVVDYAHTPDALEKVLVSLREHGAGTLFCIFGCGGDRDQGKRPQMAAVAEHLADHIVVTSDNPRSEAAEAIIDDILAGFTRAAEVRVEVDRQQAIRTAVRAASAADIVLVAGKGHEDYQEIQGVRHPFSDADEVTAALAAWGQA